jgi:hypothetical protein
MPIFNIVDLWSCYVFLWSSLTFFWSRRLNNLPGTWQQLFICLLFQVLLLLVWVPGLALSEEGDDTTISPAEQLFTPSVSATCRAGIMTIR